MYLWPWEYFNQEYLTPFGGLLRIQSSALVLTFSTTFDNRRTDNGSIPIESEKKNHMKEATHNGNKVYVWLLTFVEYGIIAHIP